MTKPLERDKFNQKASKAKKTTFEYLKLQKTLSKSEYKNRNGPFKQLKDLEQAKLDKETSNYSSGKQKFNYKSIRNYKAQLLNELLNLIY